MLASPAAADPRPATDHEQQIAGDLVKKAIARSQAGDHGAAIELYLKAYAIVPSSVLLSNIGSEFQQSGKPEDALRYFCMYLETDPGGTSAPFAEVQVEALHVQLGVGCAASRREPAAQPAASATDLTAPQNPRDALPGSAGQEAPPADSGRPTLEYVGIGTGIAGVLALGAGVYAGIRAADISDWVSRQDAMRQFHPEIRTIEDRGQNYENYQIRFLIAGGVLATTGGILFLVGRPHHGSDRLSATRTLRITPTMNGVAVFGKF